MRILLPVVMRSLSLLAVVFGLCVSAGCAHYQLGTEAKVSFHTLYLAPVENKARLPQAVAIVSTQIREAFLHDGRVTLVNSPEGADATLTVSLSHFQRDVTTSRPDDTGLARKFNLNLTALCTLRDNRTAKLLIDKRAVNVEQQIFATATPQQSDSDQLQAEYQALPQLASSLANKVAHTALDVW